MATSLPEDRAESVFQDFKKPYSEGHATAEANRCFYCLDAPCITACPTGINIPEFIRKIATGNVRGSAKTIFDSNILGMSCSRVCPVETLCVGDCVYNRLDQPPIQIGKLQRYATDKAFSEGWTFYEAGPDTGKRVALIGAGPASLAAAHRLRRFGHATTIFEKRDVVGGLNTTGVAPYKMKADRSVEEVNWVLEIGGIDIKTGVEMAGSAVGDLLNDYDAVFVGVGLGPDNHLGVDGEDLQGVHGAVDFIEEFKLNPGSYSHVRHVCVIGGGNTAIDVVREAMGLGAHNVTMVYRGVEAKMSGYHHEWDAAKVEGARAAWQTQPIAYVGDADGKVSGVRCVKLDADKKTVEGSEHTLPADLVLVAIGQSKLKDELGQLDGVETNWKCVLCDDAGATGLAGLYVGGDLRNGGMEVVNAVAEGRDAAEAMHAYMTEGKG